MEGGSNDKREGEGKCEAKVFGEGGVGGWVGGDLGTKRVLYTK